jgi:hypothetical protein
MEGQLHLSKNYFRVKHYLGSVDGKLKFEYHKQSLAYLQSILSISSLSPIDLRNIDQKLVENNSSSDLARANLPQNSPFF